VNSMETRPTICRPPPFDQTVDQTGYAWWYLDAISDDQRFGVTLIAFIGSVFSPYYVRARARGSSDPLNHCAINVALYGPQGRWSMTERGRDSVEQQADSFIVGPSALEWNGDHLSIELNEWAAPLPRRIRGQIRLFPRTTSDQSIALDPDGRHLWTPIWPEARVEMELDCPELRWSGAGYFDHNTGTEPLESRFDTWFWLRAHTQRGPVVLYDTKLRSGGERHLALRFDRAGGVESLPSPALARLPRSRWGVARPCRSENEEAKITTVWEDTPFYTRSLVEIRVLGEQVTAVHESLSLPRFSSSVVQLMLPFRMPRRRSKPSTRARK